MSYTREQQTRILLSKAAADLCLSSDRLSAALQAQSSLLSSTGFLS